ncbi:MAG: hypothetical protein ACMXYM_04565 [Candidatus Woesearchaeota archaeon]
MLRYWIVGVVLLFVLASCRFLDSTGSSQIVDEPVLAEDPTTQDVFDAQGVVKCVSNGMSIAFNESTIALYYESRGRWFTHEKRLWHVSVVLETYYSDNDELDAVVAELAPSCSWVRSDQPEGYREFVMFSANDPELYLMLATRDVPLSELSDTFECSVGEFPSRDGPECTYEEYETIVSR